MHLLLPMLACALVLATPSLAANCSSEDQGEVSFDTPSLKGKKCKDLDRDYCIFGDETKKKCPCNCKKFIYGDKDNQGGQQGAGENQETRSSGGKGGKGGRKFCFHAEDTVLAENGRRVSMRDLVHYPNQKVLTGENFAKVKYWLHAEAETAATFLVLTTTSGHQMRISSEHLIYRSITCRDDHTDTVYARRLRSGHCVRVHDPKTGTFQLTPVTNMTTEATRGIYAPITETGSIVVNGVLASCYTNYEDEAVQKVIYGFFLGARDFMTSWKPLNWIGQVLFGDRSTITAHVPMFVHSLLDLSTYFVHK